MTIGIFDSGEGGYNLLRHARRRNRRDDILFLCDRANSPYGTKRDFELSGIVNENVRLLKGMGAEKIIIACWVEGSFPVFHYTTREIDREV